jgi:hypothetical protein
MAVPLRLRSVEDWVTLETDVTFKDFILSQSEAGSKGSGRRARRKWGEEGGKQGGPPAWPGPDERPEEEIGVA